MPESIPPPASSETFLGHRIDPAWALGGGRFHLATSVRSCARRRWRATFRQAAGNVHEWYSDIAVTLPRGPGRVGAGVRRKGAPAGPAAGCQTRFVHIDARRGRRMMRSARRSSSSWSAGRSEFAKAMRCTTGVRRGERSCRRRSWRRSRTDAGGRKAAARVRPQAAPPRRAGVRLPRSAAARANASPCSTASLIVTRSWGSAGTMRFAVIVAEFRDEDGALRPSSGPPSYETAQGQGERMTGAGLAVGTAATPDLRPTHQADVRALRRVHQVTSTDALRRRARTERGFPSVFSQACTSGAARHLRSTGSGPRTCGASAALRAGSPGAMADLPGRGVRPGTGRRTHRDGRPLVHRQTGGLATSGTAEFVLPTGGPDS
jgi:hypothetical protein